MPRLWRYAFKCAEDDDADSLLPGRIPAFQEVERISRKANECQQYDHEEVSWNCSVHARLLELILEGEQGQDEDLRAKILRFSRLTPTGTVNHTDFFPVSTRPLVLIIETKKPGVHWEAAQLQIGIWHAAQWAFLRWAVADKLRRQHVKNKEQAGDSSLNMSRAQEEEHDANEPEVLSVISKLGFIPGVIVQGHRWHLVLSTYEDRKTKLWADRQFGSTQTCLESYSIIAGIRRLAEWARDIYMPWFKTHVLDND